LKWLFYSDFRSQQAFLVTSGEPYIMQGAVKGGEGTPSPMLSITGLSLEELEPHIAKTNKHLPSISQLFVFLPRRSSSEDLQRPSSGPPEENQGS